MFSNSGRLDWGGRDAHRGSHSGGRGELPQEGRAIVTPTSEGTAIGTERHARDIVSMPFKGAYVRARSRIPETDGMNPDCH